MNAQDTLREQLERIQPTKALIDQIMALSQAAAIALKQMDEMKSAIRMALIQIDDSLPSPYNLENARKILRPFAEEEQ